MYTFKLKCLYITYVFFIKRYRNRMYIYVYVYIYQCRDRNYKCLARLFVIYSSVFRQLRQIINNNNNTRCTVFHQCDTNKFINVFKLHYSTIDLHYNIDIRWLPFNDYVTLSVATYLRCTRR